MRKLKDYCKIIMKKYLKIKRIVVCVVVVVVYVLTSFVKNLKKFVGLLNIL